MMILTKTAVDGSLQESREHCPYQAAAGEDGSTLAQLLFLIPATENIMASDECGCLEDGLEESDDHDFPRMMDKARAQSQETPRYNAAGEEETRGELLEGNVAGDLTEHVATVEDCT